MQYTNIEYKEIFRQLEKTLQSQSNLSEDIFNSRFGKSTNLDYKEMLDKDIFWILVTVIFYSGMNASTVSARLPALKKYLYDFTKVKNYSKENVKRILSDPNIIHYKRKIEACIVNAKEFDKIIKKYKSFSKYLTSFGLHTDEETINKLKAVLSRRFKYLGNRTVNHFIMELGIDVLKPDRVVCRIFERLGLINNKENIAQVIAVGKKIAAATGYPIRYIDGIFVKYGQIGDDKFFGLSDGICLERNPKCHICGVNKKYCKFYADSDKKYG